MLCFWLYWVFVCIVVSCSLFGMTIDSHYQKSGTSDNRLYHVKLKLISRNFHCCVKSRLSWKEIIVELRPKIRRVIYYYTQSYSNQADLKLSDRNRSVRTIQKATLYENYLNSLNGTCFHIQNAAVVEAWCRWHTRMVLTKLNYSNIVKLADQWTGVIIVYDLSLFLIVFVSQVILFTSQSLNVN